mmetsp:Transcript_11860/g.27629  ORF Transcript_11860/g.27629 Transcript_11860/m.27629 type:complete len:521 (+) Transcript_11860:153-1715(+)
MRAAAVRSCLFALQLLLLRVNCLTEHAATAVVGIDAHGDASFRWLSAEAEEEEALELRAAEPRQELELEVEDPGGPQNGVAAAADSAAEDVVDASTSADPSGSCCADGQSRQPPPSSLLLSLARSWAWPWAAADNFVSNLGSKLRSCSTFFSRASRAGPEPQWMRSAASDGTGAPPAAPAASAVPAPAQIFFLFMTATGMERPELWNAFFQSAASEQQYRIFMHCTSKGSGMCSKPVLERYKSMNIEVVDTVPTHYCKDLVTGMVHLLRKALPLSAASSRDKFVFLSESTLPVKPFAHVYQILTADERSDFCIMPSEYWVKVGATVSTPRSPGGRLVKHHQWFVLSRANAQTLTERWIGENEKYGSLHWSVPACAGDCGSNATSLKLYRVRRNLVKQCTDEWAPFAMIYGIVMDQGHHMETIPGISHSLISDMGDHTQGMCRTFVWWYSMHSEADALIETISKDLGCKLSCYPCEGSHPVEFLVLSDTAITHLRQSSYLFARKFAGSVMTADQFQRLILS